MAWIFAKFADSSCWKFRGKKFARLDKKNTLIFFITNLIHGGGLMNIQKSTLRWWGWGEAEVCLGHVLPFCNEPGAFYGIKDIFSRNLKNVFVSIFYRISQLWTWFLKMTFWKITWTLPRDSPITLRGNTLMKLVK